MLISHSRKFIFIHIPKAAGSSMRRVLWPYQPLNVRARLRVYHALRWVYTHTFSPPSIADYGALPPDASYDRRPLNGLMRAAIKALSYRGIDHHYTASMIREIMPEAFESYYKFAFVRNPWDLHVSNYYYMLNKKWHRMHNVVNALGSFEAYLDFMLTRMDLPHQRDFVADSDGKILVDFIGRFENIQEDFRTVCGNIGIPYSMTSVNRSSGRDSDYRKHYNDRTAALVAEYFRDDIEMFGYKF